jgi:hypothetical protein
MKRRHRSTSKSKTSVVDEALEAMGAEDLRELVRGLLPWLDDKTHSRVTNEVIDRAARGETKWTPSGPTDEGVAEVLDFSEAAQRVGYADPSGVDDYLRHGGCSSARAHRRSLDPGDVCDLPRFPGARNNPLVSFCGPAEREDARNPPGLRVCHQAGGAVVRIDAIVQHELRAGSIDRRGLLVLSDSEWGEQAQRLDSIITSKADHLGDLTTYFEHYSFELARTLADLKTRLDRFQDKEDRLPRLPKVRLLQTGRTPWRTKTMSTLLYRSLPGGSTTTRWKNDWRNFEISIQMIQERLLLLILAKWRSTSTGNTLLTMDMCFSCCVGVLD